MWSSFTIESPDPPAVVRDRLAAALTSASPGWLSGPTTFRGVVWDMGFRVTRNLARVERSMPIVAIGQITRSGDGTTVGVATRPQWWIVIALGLWTTPWIGWLWQSLVSDPHLGGTDWCEVAVLIGFAASGWVLLFGVCTIEEREYQQALTRVIDPEVEARPT